MDRVQSRIITLAIAAANGFALPAAADMTPAQEQQAHATFAALRSGSAPGAAPTHHSNTVTFAAGDTDAQIAEKKMLENATEQAKAYAAKVNKNGTAAGKTAFTGSAVPAGTSEEQMLAQATEQARKYAAQANKRGK